MQKVFLSVFIFLSFFTQSQVGGQFSFEFLRLPANARQAGLGGVNVSLLQEDVNMFLQNPALLSEDNASKASLNYSPFFADINALNLTYAHNFSKIGTLGLGLQYINYGTMTERDASGLEIGNFQASDFAFTVGKSHTLDNFILGANLKFVGSQIAEVGAFGLALDVGGIFKHPEKDFVVGLSFKNLGFAVSKFTDTGSTLLPFDVQLGTSFKPEFMPFRFSITLQQLTTFDIVYLDPNQAVGFDLSGNPIVEETTFFDKALRHFVIGGELLIHKNFNVRLGYNHLINRELRVEEAGRFPGFSFGFMLRLKSLELAFSRATYHAVGGRSFFTLSMDLEKMKSKKKVLKRNED